ncbi:MAG: class I SAM-dependent methyltransferase [Anaerolineae bacterium]|nr:class I SAM-dependent methyltransferase [Anaerolineae bacterium]
MSDDDRARWDQKWAEREGGDNVPAWLIRHQSLLRGGVAVDLATGRGAAARWLARLGYHVVAVDLSAVALQQARAARHLLFVQADLDHWRPPPRSVDLITVFRFLDRRLFPMFREALRPGGLLIYETRTVGWLEREPGTSPSYLLQRVELLRLTSGLTVEAYLETERHAALVARRPAER